VFSKAPSRLSNLQSKVVKVPFNGSLNCIADLDDHHPAVIYVRDRKIPKDQWKKLYYIPNICDITKIEGFSRYKDRVKGKEPRIVLPYYNISGKMTGVTCRALGDHSLRYIALKIVDDEPMIFGVNEIDFTKTIYVVEGPFDSLFVDNCIAVGGTGMSKLDSLGISKDKMVIIFDNQPRQKEVVDIIDRTIKKGYHVVIWNGIKSKDINDMMLAGEDYVGQLQSNVCNGLMATHKFNQWKKY
jgi:hypothetical protein